MLTNLHISNFRGFKQLDIGPLKRVNLILGQNNTGKTSVLEALALLLWQAPHDYSDLPNMFRTAGGDPADDFWKWIFYNKEVNVPANIKGEFDGRYIFDVGVYSDKYIPKDAQSLSLGQIAGFQFITFSGKKSVEATAMNISTHPSNPVQDAVDYNRVVIKRKEKSGSRN